MANKYEVKNDIYVDKMKCMQVDIVIHFRGMYVQNKFSLYYINETFSKATSWKPTTSTISISVNRM